MHYKAVVIDGSLSIPSEAKSALQTLADAGRIVAHGHGDAAGDFVAVIDALVSPDVVVLSPAPDLRYRHVVKEGIHYYVFSNEDVEPLSTTLTVSVQGHKTWIDPLGMVEVGAENVLHLDLPPYALRILQVGEL